MLPVGGGNQRHRDAETTIVLPDVTIPRNLLVRCYPELIPGGYHNGLWHAAGGPCQITGPGATAVDLIDVARCWSCDQHLSIAGRLLLAEMWSIDYFTQGIAHTNSSAELLSDSDAGMSLAWLRRTEKLLQELERWNMPVEVKEWISSLLQTRKADAEKVFAVSVQDLAGEADTFLLYQHPTHGWKSTGTPVEPVSWGEVVARKCTIVSVGSNFGRRGVVLVSAAVARAVMENHSKPRTVRYVPVPGDVEGIDWESVLVLWADGATAERAVEISRLL